MLNLLINLVFTFYLCLYMFSETCKQFLHRLHFFIYCTQILNVAKIMSYIYLRFDFGQGTGCDIQKVVQFSV